MVHEFEMTQEQLDALLKACEPPMAIALHCGPPPSVQERANAAWAELGAELGFDSKTARPSRPGYPRFFYAEPIARAALGERK